MLGRREQSLFLPKFFLALNRSAWICKIWLVVCLLLKTLRLYILFVIKLIIFNQFGCKSPRMGQLHALISFLTMLFSKN
ncbi:hypothetical protein A6J80_23370 (plasmid) [Paracoccus yeei]|uniref:Uncharacterized protein n=1 Tax=Paracoccus yeei TaxID=147645 RepID=A0A1V0GZB0_9RHOB|nr:hypothetical protein A6J80_23370 [Paracoccus yeei]